MCSNIKKFSEMIKDSNYIVFFGGAGVSTESGVKDYRSQDGLYNTVKEYGVSPETILSRTFFYQHTDIFYDFYRKYFITNAKPNKAHFALAELEKMNKVKAIITQNIDGLHQIAGSKNVIELHGTAKQFYCNDCGKDAQNVIDVISKGNIPKCKYCGGVIKPKVVLYEEMLCDKVVQSAVDNIEKADMLIVGGTSLAVQPAASFIRYFRGKYIIIINKTETNFDNNANIVFRQNIGKVFEDVMNEMF